METFTAVQLWQQPMLLPDKGVFSTIYMSRRTYDSDLNAAFQNEGAAWRQAGLDLPRSRVEVDGVRMTRPSPIVGAHFVRYVTQAIMGIPIEALHRAGALPVERTGCIPACRALRISVDTEADEVLARKRLRLVLPPNGPIVSICIVVHAMSEHVRIDFVRDTATCPCCA